MKINGTIFSKPQQDQLKRAIENSNGGTTLNKYTFTVNTKPSIAQVTKILQILNKAIRVLNIEIKVTDSTRSYMISEINEHKFKCHAMNAYSNVYIMYTVLLRDDIGASGISADKTEFNNSTFSTNTINLESVTITYLNDTEITD